MTQEEIKHLNDSGKYDTWNQGIFIQPNHIPIAIKDPVVYMRWDSWGYSGGNCWGDEPEEYENDEPEFDVLYEVCKYLNPNISQNEINMIHALSVVDDGGEDDEYYGNATYYKVRYVPLSVVEKWVENFKLLSLKERAILWWNELSNEDQYSLEVDYGYYGHDIGLTQGEIIFIYIQENKNNG